MKKVVDHIQSFSKDHDVDIEEGLIKFKITVRDFYIMRDAYWKNWRNCYPEVVSWVMKEKRYKTLYKVCYYLATKGIVAPFRLYRILSRYNS